jgi:hypothetical protein
MTRDRWIQVWIAFNALCLVGFTIAWPVTALTTFSDEPQGVLGLSYIALIIGAMGNLIATLILQQVDNS